MEVERTQNSTTAKAPEPDQEIAPTQASQEARKRRFHALLPSTESPSRHRQLSRPSGTSVCSEQVTFSMTRPAARRLASPGMGQRR